MRPFFSFTLYTLLFLCALASCQRTVHVVPAEATAANGAERAALRPEDSLQFRLFFLDAIRQKGVGRIDAEFELLQEALAIHPEAPEALYEMAVIELQHTAYSDTLLKKQGTDHLRKAIALDPHNLFYKQTLAEFLANKAEFREALLLYEEIADSKPSTETLMMLVWLYGQVSDYAGVIRALERIEQLDGPSEQISLTKFQTYLEMKDDEQAYRAIEDLCAKYPSDLRYRVLLGDMYDQNGHHEMALDIYRDVLTAEPNNSYAQLSLLAYYQAAGADSLYLDLLHRVVLNPHTQSDTRVEVLRAYAARQMQRGADMEPVMALFSKALQMPQEDADLAEMYFYALAGAKQSDDLLLEAARHALEIDPTRNSMRLQMLRIYLERNDLQTVIDVCRLGRQYNPAELTFNYYEGLVLYQKGQDRDAILTLRLGASHITDDSDPELCSDLYALLGDILYDNDNPDAAFRAFDKALHYNAGNITCLNNYAYYLSLIPRDLDKAERMSRLTVEADDSAATYLDTYAWILFLQKRMDEARTYIDRALKCCSDVDELSSVVLDHAGDIYYHTGDKAQALSFWKKALKHTNDRALQRKLRRKVACRRPVP